MVDVTEASFSFFCFIYFNYYYYKNFKKLSGLRCNHLIDLLHLFFHCQKKLFSFYFIFSLSISISDYYFYEN